MLFGRGLHLTQAGGGPPLPGHRYWRFTTRTNSSTWSIREVEFHIGGVDQIGSGTMTLQKTINSGTAADLIDGSTSTGVVWGSANTADSVQFTYDFGVNKEIDGMYFYKATSGWMYANRIDYSDDNSTWTNAYTASNWFDTGTGTRTYTW